MRRSSWAAPRRHLADYAYELTSYTHALGTAGERVIERALFDAFDLRVVYDKDGDRLSISATLTEAVASMLHNGLEPLWQEALRGWDSNPQLRS